MQQKINNLLVILIIICSTSVFSLSALGPLAKATELLGIVLIVVFLLIHVVYSEQIIFKHYFTFAIGLLFFSLLTSMLMAKYSRDQNFADTLLAQRAIYYYLFYFLLHQLKIRPRDLERIIIFFGILHVVMYIVQFFLYPKVIFDVFMLADRGTIRVYLKGSDYMAIAFFMSIQAFLRTNKIKYLFLTSLFFLIFILLGSRQTMAIMAFTMVLFIIFSKKVKSRLLIGFLVASCVSFVFIMFQDIFKALLLQSSSDLTLGTEYIRFMAAKHFLTDFFRNGFAYITGNGMFANTSSYGNEIERLKGNGFYLGDIGIIGNYVIYGAFFIAGVFLICVKVLRVKVEDNQAYIKYMFIAILLSLITGGGFANADFICAIVCLLYLVDVSNWLGLNKNILHTDNN